MIKRSKHHFFKINYLLVLFQFIYIYIYIYRKYPKICQLDVIKKQSKDSKSRERYQNLFEKEKSKKQEYGREQYKNLPEN